MTCTLQARGFLKHLLVQLLCKILHREHSLQMMRAFAQVYQQFPVARAFHFDLVTYKTLLGISIRLESYTSWVATHYACLLAYPSGSHTFEQGVVGVISLLLK